MKHGYKERSQCFWQLNCNDRSDHVRRRFFLRRRLGFRFRQLG